MLHVFMNLYLLWVTICIRKGIFTVTVVEKQLEEVIQRSCGVFIHTDIENLTGTVLSKLL